MAGLASLILLRDIKFYIALILFLFGIFCSGIYEHRIVYYIPYVCVLLFFITQKFQSLNPNMVKRFTQILSILLVYNIAISLVVRTGLAFAQYDKRNSKNYAGYLSQIGINEGDYVLTNSWRTYFPLRQIGAFPIKEMYNGSFSETKYNVTWIISNVKNENNLHLSELIGVDTVFPNWYLEKVQP